MENLTYALFLDARLLAQGDLTAVLPVAKAEFDRDPGAPILLFEEQTGAQVDFDLRGTLAVVLERALPPRPGPGRPRLGVVAREISLLPRHWEWLEQQPGGASASLRRLVDAARHQSGDGVSARQAREAIGRILTALAGNLPGYEEACRALYAADRPRFEAQILAWPADLRAYLLTRASQAF